MAMSSTRPASGQFELMEATIAGIHAAYAGGVLSARELVEGYLARVEALDRDGPRINSIINLNPACLEIADSLDVAYLESGFRGPLHGIPVIVKDQIDVKGMPTTLGSVLFKNYYPDRDSFVAEQLRAAGAIILGKATLGELGRGDTHGTLFGSTRNPYNLDRTVGGSSGGSAAAAASNFAAVTLGQEGFASIRRPAGWNCVVGMRPTSGLVSRGGVYGGWPSRAGSVGPITRTVTDLAKVLDAIVAYDPEDPSTVFGVGHVPESYTMSLDEHGLAGVRVGVIREPMGQGSEPSSPDFEKVSAVFDRAIEELAATGATIVDDISIPFMKELLTKRATDGDHNEQLVQWLGRSATPPYRSLQDLMAQPAYAECLALRGDTDGGGTLAAGEDRRHAYMRARRELMTNFLKVMADERLDVIVHKTVEHTPTRIDHGTKPPFVNHKGAIQLNTFLIYAPAITVPAGFTEDALPVGITFVGRPYSDAALVRYAYAYEQATGHRTPPALTVAT